MAWWSGAFVGPSSLCAGFGCNRRAGRRLLVRRGPGQVRKGVLDGRMRAWFGEAVGVAGLLHDLGGGCLAHCWGGGSLWWVRRGMGKVKWNEGSAVGFVMGVVPRSIPAC